MNALVHQHRFLRPLRSAMFTAICASVAFGFSKTFLGLDLAAAQMSAYLVALPLMTGIFVAGAAHEPLHLPFALLLPGLGKRQLRFAALTTGLAALALTLIAYWTTPFVSPVAGLGLIVALLALPHLDSHQTFGYFNGPGREIIVWILLSLAFDLGLPQALSADPWLFLVCGLAFAAFALRHGYSRSALRLRSHLPFVAYQTQLFFHLFNPAVAERWRTDRLSRLKNRDSASTPAGRLAASPPITTSLRAWLQVLRQLHFGAWQSASPFSLHTTLLVTVLGCFALFPAIGLYSGQPDYWAALAHSINYKATTQFQFVTATTLILLATPPTITFPISRAFLGRINFWHALTIWLFAVLYSLALVSLPSLIGQIMSGHALPGYGLPALINRALFLAPLLPLVIAVNQRPARRPLVMVVSIFIATMASFRAHALLTDYAPEPVGVSIFLIATAGGLALLRHHLYRHYANCDLPSGTTPARSSSLPAP